MKSRLKWLRRSAENAVVFTARPGHTPERMTPLNTTQEVPLSVSENGTMRVAGTRVSLESVLHHYQQGATAEEIALRFPALRLADIHGCLAYYLNHQEAIEEYLVRQQRHADDLRQRIASDPAQQHGLSQMRERIQNRAASRRPEVS